MKVIITGGGTGGHIYPAIAIADKFRENEPDCQILYVGRVGGLEGEIVPKAGYDIKFIDAQPLNRKKISKIIKTGFKTLKGIAQAKKIMKTFDPDVVIGTGGFVCAPVMIAGHMHGARCYLHEQNAFPGVANKSLEGRASKVFLGFEEAGKYFKEPAKHVYVGNPVRKAFYDANQSEARKRLGFSEDDFVIFSFGGSQGAKAINNVSYELLKAVNNRKNIRLIFGTGKRYYEDIKNKLCEEGIEAGENIQILDYIDNMPDYIAASDLIISRAGALSVAETCVCGKASIMVPYPWATGNHQYFNAKSVEDKGGCILIEEADLNAEDVIRQVMKLRNDRELLESMSRASHECAPVDTCQRIYTEIKKDR